MNVGPINQLVAVIQSQFAGRAASQKAKGKHTAGSRYGREGLNDLIAARVNAIDADDPQRRRKAFRVFLEAVLIAELGEAMLKDPRFFQLVDDVQQAMELDPACNKMVEAATTQLLEKK